MKPHHDFPVQAGKFILIPNTAPITSNILLSEPLNFTFTWDEQFVYKGINPVFRIDATLRTALYVSATQSVADSFYKNDGPSTVKSMALPALVQ